MKVWKDKDGKKITAKEFVKRFKEGLSEITPQQKIKNEARSTFIMLIGYISGLVSLIVYRKLFTVQWFTYALIIIFIGASYGQLMKWIVLRQQAKLFKNLGEDSLDLTKIFGGLEKEKLPIPNFKEKKK